MSVKSDEAYLVEREYNNIIWLRILGTTAILFSAVFVVLVTFTFLTIQDLDAKEAAVTLQIETLLQKLRDAKGKRGQLGTSGEELMEEVLGNVVGDVGHDTSGGEKRRGRRQNNVLEAILVAQRVVFEKHCVSGNTTCPQGRRGDRGTAGYIGVNGTDGSVGVNGSKGTQGERGGPGFQGQLGVHVSGDSGTNGTRGIIGDIGVLGETGPQGANGTDGQKGAQGISGTKGPIGDTGQPGLNGTDGINGTKGELGDAGTQGMNGTKGSVGPKGKDSRKFADGCGCYNSPVFRNPNDETVTLSGSGFLRIPCDGEGNPAPTITVFNPRRKNGRKRTLVKNGNVYTIRMPTTSEYGKYLCTATNPFGSTTKTVTVKQAAGG